KRASVWYEDNGLELEAFHHAAAANDIERTERLIEGAGVPLHYRVAAVPVLHWLESLPPTVLDDRPSLWVTYASALFFTGQHTAVEQKLQAAEAALRDAEDDDSTQDLVGRIASIRATLAVIQRDLATIIAQSRLALEYLHPDNLLFRSAAAYTLGVAYHFQGDRAAASQSFTEVLSITESLEDSIYTIAAAISLGLIQEADNQLSAASKSYKRSLQLAGDPPMLIACEAFLGLARIHYQWNDLDTAQEYGLQCAQLMQQMDSIDTFASYGVFLARLKLTQRDGPGAAAALDEAEAFARQHNFLFRMPDVAAAQVLVLLRQEPLLQQDNLTAAADLAGQYELPISQARVHLAQGDPAAALALLEPLRRQMEDKDWLDEQLKIVILQALAHQAHGEKEIAVQQLGEALAMAEPGGFIRVFVDEGQPMAQLLSETAARGILPDYCGKLLAVFETERQHEGYESYPSPEQPLIDSLTKRELEILFLIADGLKNKEIAEQLVISLNTVLYHIKNIYSKLGVNKRTQAIAKAKEINLF
ncbi:MAG: LuxR C-terminal-related transcriptional regulator, partial [Candidatus Promineifilaceae bacterium]